MNIKIGKFDLIIGSDLLYQEDHPKLLSSFIDKHAMKNCEVIIVAPKRRYLNPFTKEMQLLSYSYEKIKPEDTSYLKNEFDGHIHRYKKCDVQ